MIVGEGFYAWNPNYFQSKDPDTRRYFGNVIGNVPLEDQLKVVDDEGTKQKTYIRTASEEQVIAIGILAEKYVTFWEIVDRVEQALTGEDPAARAGADSQYLEDLMDAWIAEQAASQTDISGSETPEEPIPAAVPFDDSPLTWNPNYFQIKDQETRRYFGNAIGNLSLEEQLKTVTDAGALQKTAIFNAASADILDISERSEKFRHVTRVNKNVMKELVSFFGGVFMLDSSALDTTPIS